MRLCWRAVSLPSPASLAHPLHSSQPCARCQRRGSVRESCRPSNPGSPWFSSGVSGSLGSSPSASGTPSGGQLPVGEQGRKEGLKRALWQARWNVPPAFPWISAVMEPRTGRQRGPSSGTAIGSQGWELGDPGSRPGSTRNPPSSTCRLLLILQVSPPHHPLLSPHSVGSPAAFLCMSLIPWSLVYLPC